AGPTVTGFRLIRPMLLLRGARPGYRSQPWRCVMKHSRPVLTVLAALAFGTWATLAFACEDKASASAAAVSSKSTTCSAAMAAKCTPEMAAACKAKGASAAASSGCPHGAKTSTKAASGRNLDGVTLAAPGGTSGVDAVLIGSGAGCNHGSASAAGTASAAGSGTCSGHGMAKTADAY